MKSLSKKGFQLQEVPMLISVMLVLAIIIGLSVTIIQNVRDGDNMRTTATRFYTNSTFVSDNATAVDFTPSDILRDSSGWDYLVSGSCSNVAIANATDLADITTDFTISGCTATLKANATDLNSTNMKANFTYTHYVYTIAYNTTQLGMDAQEDLSGWQSTWVVIIAAAVVIGIIGKMLFFK